MTNFCINTLCLKNKSFSDIENVLESALSFLAKLWMFEDREDEIFFHMDKEYLNQGFLFAEFLDHLTEKDHDSAIFVSKKIVFPCFENNSLLNQLTNVDVLYKNVIEPDALIFYYAYLGNNRSKIGPYVVLSFFNPNNWNVNEIDFQVSDRQTATSSYKINNQYYANPNTSGRIIACKFFPFSLHNASRFRKSTHDPIKGAVVYEEIATGNLWYKDTLHTGARAHYEVFSSLGVHIGEASMDGSMISNSADPSKNWKI